MATFEELGLSEETLNAVAKKGFEEPSDIQALTIPPMLTTRQDLIAQAQTGTGKTAAFALPLIDTIDDTNKTVQALILAPTRELVIQICEEINSLKGRKYIAVAPIYGGQSITIQLKQLRKGVQIVVGTPGRIIDHIRRKTLDLSKITDLVMDEADEMLNMGFIEDIETIMEQTNKTKRTLLFSATMPPRIKALASKYLTEPQHLKTKANLTTDLTDQIYFEVHQRDKFEALSRIIDIEEEFFAIIFCRTKVETDEVANQLASRGYPAEPLHGDISQAQREKTLRKFRKGVVSVLVATDVAARGIDVTNVTHVINYSLPQNAEAYVHRIGRTGRAGKEGTAITFVTPSEFRKLSFIKRSAKADLRRVDVPSVEKIIAEQRKRIQNELGEITEAEANEEFVGWANELLEQVDDPGDLIAALLEATYGRRLDTSNYKEITPMRKRGERGNNGRDRGRDAGRKGFEREGRRERGERTPREDRSERKPRSNYVEQEGTTRLFIAKGKNDDFNKKKLTRMMSRSANADKSAITNVSVYDTYSFITAPFDVAEKILRNFRDEQRGRKPMVSKARK